MKFPHLFRRFADSVSPLVVDNGLYHKILTTKESAAAVMMLSTITFAEWANSGLQSSYAVPFSHCQRSLPHFCRMIPGHNTIFRIAMATSAALRAWRWQWGGKKRRPQLHRSEPTYTHEDWAVAVARVTTTTTITTSLTIMSLAVMAATAGAKRWTPRNSRFRSPNSDTTDTSTAAAATTADRRLN